MIDKQYLKEYYEKEGETECHTEVYERYQHQIRKYWVEEMVDASKDTIALDVGSGEGVFTIDAAKKFRRAVGVELAKSKIKKAVESSKKIGNIDFVIADAERLPFKDNVFGATICAEVLEHLPEPEKALEEISRVTKEQVIISVPTNEVCIPYRIYSPFMRKKEDKFDDFGGGHLREYTPEKILKDLEKVGLQPVKIAGTFLFAVPSSILNKVKVLKSIYFILDKTLDDKFFFNRHGYHTVVKCLRIGQS